MSNYFPLLDFDRRIPKGTHPGAFGAVRKYDIHTGVDLYTSGPQPVQAVESGIVVAIEDYTGPRAGTSWWNDTRSILIEGKLGVICYGEIEPVDLINGQAISAGQMIGTVKNVLTKEKIRIDIPGHSNYMLHFELYTKGTKNQ